MSTKEKKISSVRCPRFSCEWLCDIIVLQRTSCTAKNLANKKKTFYVLVIVAVMFL